MAKIIKFKKEANLKQTSLRILGAVAMLMLLMIVFCSIIPWGLRAAALAGFTIGAMQFLKTATNP